MVGSTRGSDLIYRPIRGNNGPVMSAAPKLEPVESSTSSPEPAQVASDGEGFALLEALRRKLDDQASQGRKTQQPGKNRWHKQRNMVD